MKPISITKIVTITARAKAFQGEGVRENQFRVEPNGEVTVWDSLCGYYTSCHSISKRTQDKLRKLAAQQ